MKTESWKDFDEMFGISDEARFVEDKSLGRTNMVIELTLNYPLTASYERMSGTDRLDLYKHTFIDIINYLHNKYGNVLQTTYEMEYSPKMHLHGYIEISSLKGGTPYGLAEEVLRYALTFVKPGRGRENTWDRVQTYPFCKYRVPFCCVSVGPKEKSEGWDNYIKKNALKNLEQI